MTSPLHQSRRLVHKGIGAQFWKRSAMSFAKKHRLVYFQHVDSKLPVISGTTSFPGHEDENICIGTHAGYDITLFDRSAIVEHEGYRTVYHRWYVLQIDLKKAKDLPHIFLGTSQQSKAYYADVLAHDTSLQLLKIDTNTHFASLFHGNYAVLASPDYIVTVGRLFTDDVVDTLGHHGHPFTVEIMDDSVIVTTKAVIPSRQLMDKLLHFGIWIAKEIDKKLA